MKQCQHRRQPNGSVMLMVKTFTSAGAIFDYSANCEPNVTKCKRWVVVLGVVLLGLAAAVAIILVCVILDLRAADRVIWQDCQPPSINYGSFDPYLVSVLEGRKLQGSQPIPSTKRYYIFIGRGTDAPSYGNYLDFAWDFGSDDPDVHIKASKVEWTPEGLTFIAKTGQTLSVPKKSFIGGR